MNIYLIQLENIEYCNFWHAILLHHNTGISDISIPYIFIRYKVAVGNGDVCRNGMPQIIPQYPLAMVINFD